MDVRVGLWRKLSTEELMLLNCNVGEDSWESLGPQKIQPVHHKGNQSWIFTGRTDAKAEAPNFSYLMQIANSLEKTLTLRKTEGRRRRGQQRTRWLMASLTWWTWVWASSSRWWRTGKPGVLQAMGSRRVGHDWATEQWTTTTMPQCVVDDDE